MYAAPAIAVDPIQRGAVVGRWIAETIELPGVMCYGHTLDEAISKTDRIAHGELPSSSLNLSFSIPDEQLARSLQSSIRVAQDLFDSARSRPGAGAAALQADASGVPVVMLLK